MHMSGGENGLKSSNCKPPTVYRHRVSFRRGGFLQSPVHRAYPPDSTIVYQSAPKRSRNVLGGRSGAVRRRGWSGPVVESPLTGILGITTSLLLRDVGLRARSSLSGSQMPTHSFSPEPLGPFAYPPRLNLQLTPALLVLSLHSLFHLLFENTHVLLMSPELAIQLPVKLLTSAGPNYFLVLFDELLLDLQR